MGEGLILKVGLTEAVHAEGGGHLVSVWRWHEQAPMPVNNAAHRLNYRASCEALKKRAAAQPAPPQE